MAPLCYSFLKGEHFNLVGLLHSLSEIRKLRLTEVKGFTHQLSVKSWEEGPFGGLETLSFHPNKSSFHVSTGLCSPNTAVTLKSGSQPRYIPARMVSKQTWRQVLVFFPQSLLLAPWRSLKLDYTCVPTSGINSQSLLLRSPVWGV